MPTGFGHFWKKFYQSQCYQSSEYFCKVFTKTPDAIKYLEEFKYRIYVMIRRIGPDTKISKKYKTNDHQDKNPILISCCLIKTLIQ